MIYMFGYEDIPWQEQLLATKRSSDVRVFNNAQASRVFVSDSWVSLFHDAILFKVIKR